jgi:thioredoxin 1
MQTVCLDRIWKCLLGAGCCGLMFSLILIRFSSSKVRTSEKQEVFLTNEPIHVTDSEFEEQVLNSALPVIVDFWAPWCGPCRMVAPILDKLAQEYTGKLVVAKVNTDENPEWAMQFGVQGIPTMLAFANGQLLREQVGALPEPLLRNFVEEFLQISGAATPQ